MIYTTMQTGYRAAPTAFRTAQDRLVPTGFGDMVRTREDSRGPLHHENLTTFEVRGELNAEAAEALASMPAQAVAPRRTRTERQQVVYFLRGGGLVKVGTTDRLAHRIRALQAASPVPLELLLAAPGGVAVERAVHARLAESQHHSEWFAPTPELVAIMWMAAENGRRWRKLGRSSSALQLAGRDLMQCFRDARKAVAS